MLPEIDSTNAEAARLARNVSGPLWLLALRQTQGRGRRGRTWSDPEGNFAATYLCRPDGPAEQVAQHSFVAALALREALVAATGKPQAFALKWPNDVLLNGGKLAGILLESLGGGRSGATAVQHLAIGIGVNLRAAPDAEPEAVPPVNLLAETGLHLGPEAFLDLLAPAFARWQRQLLTYGFAPIRTAWLSQATHLGQPITARTMAGSHTGTFLGIDATGALLLRGAAGVQTIPAADIYFS